MKLLPLAIQAGVSYSEYWDLTPGEMSIIIETHKKHKLMDDYNLSFMIINAQAKHSKSLYEMFPDTFEEEAKQAEIQRLTAFMQAQMAAHNNKK